MSWRAWFESKARAYPNLKGAEESRYQAFKARLIEELAVQTDELLRPAELVEKSANPRPWY